MYALLIAVDRVASLPSFHTKPDLSRFHTTRPS
jgi:hypothetical protein